MSQKTLMDQALGDYFDSLFGDEVLETSAIAASETAVEHAPQSDSYRDKIRQQRELQPLKTQPQPLEKLFEQAQKPSKLAEETSLPQVLPVFKTQVEPVPEPAVEIAPVDEKAQLEELVVETQEQLEPEPAEQKPQWSNVETEDSFQTLFFEVAGVVFGVPLTELGGIHRITEVSPLFGKPDWFGGIMLDREQKLSVVDTVKWVMPGQNIEAEYQYLVMLGESAWGLQCEQLRGTEWLNRDDVKWRAKAGTRPWLAGMVKNKMCALLHVSQMVEMLDAGINIEGQ
ncbi:chemotaxis protein CheW [Alginatibacterium sediminis]|uniref:Chemotaxis protein CheW n=1 Tax=Alginatibacterium sediminis TaxID=2164068 RepID=A0A420EFR8_9ALTE|nr:chemotaxis protein CheW [Alginatibacterium sediminis]RKF19503.1 chemotaxis protein CheW [Alginatibacterium sediminis]